MRTSALLLWSASVGLFAGTSDATAAPSRTVSVYLERNGYTDGDGEVSLPRFGGGDRVWSGVVACVKQHFAPFDVDIADARPARGPYITAVVGGLASMVGLDDRITNGVGPYSGDVIPNATVFVFSQVGTGERDVGNLCAVTAHEIAHALGLDHSTKCGDIMSYELDRCGTRKFLDATAACGEGRERRCGDGADAQNSFRKLAAKVGLRGQPKPEPRPEPAPQHDPWADATDDDQAYDDDGAAHEEYDEADDEQQPEDPYAEAAYARAKLHRMPPPAAKAPKAGPSCGGGHAWRKLRHR
jgi:hypothetical protein